MPENFPMRMQHFTEEELRALLAYLQRHAPDARLTFELTLYVAVQDVIRQLNANGAPDALNQTRTVSDEDALRALVAGYEASAPPLRLPEEDGEGNPLDLDPGKLLKLLGITW